MALQQQAAQQKAALEQQAMQLTMEFQQRKADEEMQKQQYEMEKAQLEMQQKMAKEMERFSAAPQFAGLTMPGMAMAPMQTQVGGGAVYTYGPNGELVQKS